MSASHDTPGTTAPAFTWAVVVGPLPVERTHLGDLAVVEVGLVVGANHPNRLAHTGAQASVYFGVRARVSVTEPTVFSRVRTT